MNCSRRRARNARLNQVKFKLIADDLGGVFGAWLRRSSSGHLGIPLKQKIGCRAILVQIISAKQSLISIWNGR